ncbi:MAG: serine/threonine protein kinase [Pseudomonadales bacterium]
MTDTPYETLTPDIILEAIETLGHLTDGTLTALNSYENRVYQIGLEDGEPIIAKFYRPGRWTDECIREEHDFTQELLENEIPCVAPLSVDGQTLFRVPDTEFRFALFPRRAGRPPNIEDRDVLSVMGRALARIHSTGGSQHFTHRPSLTSQRLGHESRAFLLSSNFIPTELVDAYESITEHLLQRIDTFFADQPAGIRIHGDCHLGNLLWRYDAPNFVDFDDTQTGPPIQDLWMLLSGTREEQESILSDLLEAYSMFCSFDSRTISLIEPLRTLRMIHHAAWIGRRWNDPAFPLAFPWFNDIKYWSDHVLSLREQLAMLDEPALSV